MKTLHVNFKLLNYPNEAFSIDRDIDTSDDIFFVDDLPTLEKEVYHNFIDLVGHTNLILNDVELTNELTIFNRIKLFDHDENYSILNLGNELKSYNDYSDEAKTIIDLFLILITNKI